MGAWWWAQTAAALLIGWLTVAGAIRLFSTPLPRPSGPKTWGYWIARAIVWGFLLMCGTSGSYVTISYGTVGYGEPGFGKSLVAFFVGALLWVYIAAYAVYCYGFVKCLG